MHPPQVDYKPRPALTGIHEIKHDGFRLTARRDPVGIRPITRRGNDWTTATLDALQATIPHLTASRGGREPPQGPVLPDRWRGGVLR